MLLSNAFKFLSSHQEFEHANIFLSFQRTNKSTVTTTKAIVMNVANEIAIVNRCLWSFARQFCFGVFNDNAIEGLWKNCIICIICIALLSCIACVLLCGVVLGWKLKAANIYFHLTLINNCAAFLITFCGRRCEKIIINITNLNHFAAVNLHIALRRSVTFSKADFLSKKISRYRARDCHLRVWPHRWSKLVPFVFENRWHDKSKVH